MSAQLDALNAQIARQTAAINALKDAVAKIPAVTPPEDLGPATEALKANNDALEAVVTQIPAAPGGTN